MSTEDHQSSDSRLEDWLSTLRRRMGEDEQYGVEQFFADVPEASVQAVNAVELIYESHCLQRLRGMEEPTELIEARFPKWKSKLEVVFAADRVLSQVPEPIEFPEPGERYKDFELHRELGRGAKGRVFLATQPSLSDRPVVLKIAPSFGDEHLSLARLQHSAIVPLLFCQDDSERGIRTLCMPYLGGCTLDQAMKSMAGKEIRKRSGKDFVDAIRQNKPSVTESMVDRPAMRFLATANYEQAVCWIVGCLAEGLH